VHNLRAFIFNPTQVNPLEVAQQNEQEFLVDEIIAHRGDHHRRYTMEFLVRGTGYEESSNSWEPYKALMHADKLRNYLREHRMRSLIPRALEVTENLFQDFPRLFSSKDWFSP
jgi:hypothetical protein